MRLPASFVDKTGGATVLLAIDKTDATLMVVTRSKPTQAEPARLRADFLTKFHYKVISSSQGKVGTEAAALFVCEGVLKNQMPDTYQNYQTVMALVPLKRGLYTFQIHVRREKMPRLKGLYPGWLATVEWL